MMKTEDIKIDDGRVLSVRTLDPGDMLDLIEAAGSAVASDAAHAWLSYAQMVCSVSSIDGIPVQMPVNKHEIRELARRLGQVGVDALMRHEEAAYNANMDFSIAKN